MNPRVATTLVGILLTVAVIVGALTAIAHEVGSLSDRIQQQTTAAQR